MILNLIYIRTIALIIPTDYDCILSYNANII